MQILYVAKCRQTAIYLLGTGSRTEVPLALRARGLFKPFGFCSLAYERSAVPWALPVTTWLSPAPMPIHPGQSAPTVILTGFKLASPVETKLLLIFFSSFQGLVHWGGPKISGRFIATEERKTTARPCTSWRQFTTLTAKLHRIVQP